MMHGSVRRVAGKNSADAYFLSDEFDIYNRSQLFAALEESIGYRSVTIDLAHTTFIDAGILGVLVRLANGCGQNNGARVSIVNASTYIRRLFTICQLESILDMEGHRAQTVSRSSVGSTSAVGTILNSVS